MRVNCTDWLLCMRLRNSFNSLRLYGQQEMKHKNWRDLKVSAVEQGTNTLLCFTGRIACVGVSLSLCACIYELLCGSHLPSRTHQPQYGSSILTHDWQSLFWRHVCTGTLAICSIKTWNLIKQSSPGESLNKCEGFVPWLGILLLYCRCK